MPADVVARVVPILVGRAHLSRIGTEMRDGETFLDATTDLVMLTDPTPYSVYYRKSE